MVRYRHARSGDAAAIATLHADSWRVAYRGAYRDEFLDGEVLQDRLDVWRARLAAPPPNQLVVVAEEEHRLVGFACAYGGDDVRWGTLLDNLHVRRDGHRHGIGTRLVSDVATWCRAHYPDDGLYLWVLEGNHQARRFYERLGATDRGGAVSVPPGGGRVKSRRYAWTRLADVATS
jgi:GNAT superfamily N-acetyltransferase